MVQSLLPFIVTMVVGVLAYYIMQGAKRGITIVDGLSATSKRIAVFLISLVLTWLGQKFGAPIACQPDQNCLTLVTESWAGVVAQGAVGLLVAHFTFTIQRKTTSG